MGSYALNTKGYLILAYERPRENHTVEVGGGARNKKVPHLIPLKV